MSGDDPTADSRASTVQLNGLGVSLGDLSVLSNVSLSVQSGTFLGLIGPNGAGKTTLLRTVNGLVDPDAGSVTIDGESIGDLSSKAASRRVATVPQETTLAFDFSVREVVEMGRHPHRSRFGGDGGTDAVDTALERTDVAHLADRPITEVSGGERQRILLARALAQDTPVLLLDEPTASLDVNHQVRTLELVSGLAADGRTIVAAIHDLDLAARYCDRLALLSGGRIVACGRPEEVLAVDALGTAFDASVIVTRDQVTAAPSVTTLADADEDREASVHVVAGNGSAAGVIAPLVGAGFEVSVGVLGEEDPDHEVATRLGCEVVTVPPFTPVDGGLAEARTAARDADTTLFCDVAVGPENEANIDVVAESDAPVLIEDRPFPERNHAGESARTRYEAIRERALVTTSEGVLDAIEAACRKGDPDPEDSSSDATDGSEQTVSRPPGRR